MERDRLVDRGWDRVPRVFAHKRGAVQGFWMNVRVVVFNYRGKFLGL